MSSGSAWAQEEDDEAPEQIIVTGSHIKRSSFEGPSPVEVLTRDDFALQQPEVITDITRRLTGNTGAEFQEDQFTQNATSGTASVNLRGLGLSSTLVLINGRRAVTSPGAPNTGATFIDINNFPVDLIERVEIVKDGAAALYGSDAVAGVFNFITRDFEGFELTGSWQSTTEDLATKDAQEDLRLAAVFGVQGDRSRFTGNISWLNRKPLDFENRKFTLEQDGVLLGTSGLGSPPSFIPLGVNPAGFAPLVQAADPGCDTAENSQTIPGGVVLPGGVGSPTTCQFQFAPSFQLVGRETRIDGFGTFEHDLTDTIKVFAEIGWNTHRNSRTTSPSFPALSFPQIPAANPGNPTGTGVGAGDGVPVVFFGRAFGEARGPEVSRNQIDTWRVVGGFEGELQDVVSLTGGPELPDFISDVTWSFDYIWTESRLNLRTADTLAQNFFDALDGFAGPDCDRGGAGAPTDPDCFFFNPFASALTAGPGDPGFNDPLVIDEILGKIEATTTTQLQVFDALFGGTALDLPGGRLGWALGFQYRSESRDLETDDNSQADRFLFTVGTPEVSARRGVFSVFGELQLPVIDGVEIQFAVRHENYTTAGNSTDPKIGVKIEPFQMPGLDAAPEFLLGTTIRANYSTAFRAPSLFQQTATGTALEGLVDTPTSPLSPQTFRAQRNFGDPDLDNEESETISAGLTFEPLDGLSVSADWWYFDYEDIIVRPSAQAILNAIAAAGAAPGSAAEQAVCNATPGCLSILRDPDAGNALLRVNTTFFNAASVTTDGFDFAFEYTFMPNDWTDPGFDLGVFNLKWDATYIRQFEIDAGGGLGKVDVAGQRNFTNFSSSLPELRWNLGLIWTWENLTIANFVRYIDDYEDDEGLDGTPGDKIDSWTTWDLSIAYQFEEILGGTTILSTSLINVTDEDPPNVLTNGGFDTKVHDPRGRLWQVGLTHIF
ncbi:MAG: TonB-dependent receptor [Proteobacteria bacterium]|nr:TonB-dependent receptor [Pseudomonadota bacterium]